MDLKSIKASNCLIMSEQRNVENLSEKNLVMKKILY